MRSKYQALIAALRGHHEQRHRGAAGAATRSRERGQVLPIFVIMAVVLLAGAALLTDVAWWWTMEQRMQRAADAGALAGAVYLPGNEPGAFAAAIAEVKKNGFDSTASDVTVTPRRDPDNARKLIVDIDAPVETFFAQVVGMSEVDVGVPSAVEMRVA